MVRIFRPRGIRYIGGFPRRAAVASGMFVVALPTFVVQALREHRLAPRRLPREQKPHLSGAFVSRGAEIRTRDL